MARFSDRTTSTTQSFRHQRHNPKRHNSKRFWCFLVGSSVLLHIGLMSWVEIVQNHAPISLVTNHVTPIDWVELPARESAETAFEFPPNGDEDQQTDRSAQPEAEHLSTTPTSVPPKATSLETRSSAIAVNPNIDPNDAASGLIQNDSNDSIEATETDPHLDQSHFATAVQSDPTTSESTPPAAIAPEDAPLADPTTTSAEQQSPATETADRQSSPSPAEAPHIERIATATPTPLLSTQRIDVPIPDVSGRLPASEDPGSDLATTVTEQISIPSQLTASLTATSLPPERDQVLDEVAEPTTDVQTFSSNPASSPCQVTPEAVQFLGKTVAMQVITNEKGEVVHTITHKSSQSMAYDELAICLVKNWTFAPAIARGQPVANDGLVVHITIDRS